MNPLTRRWLATLTVIACLATSATLLSDPALADHPPPRGIPYEAESAMVREIVDGDTFRITLEDGTKDTLRLIGIDTPETRSPGDPRECYGPQSTERLAKLLPVGREIWLEEDETNRDRFDRLLRYVWVEKKHGDVYLLNEVMVRDGFAIARRYAPDTARAERLERAQERAINAGRGLWEACPELVADLTPIADPPTPVPQPTEPVATDPIPIGGGCDLSYPTLCLPPGTGNSLNRPDVGVNNFTVYQPDPHRFDGDYDGVGCES